jgi:hypothetical protein
MNLRSLTVLLVIVAALLAPAAAVAQAETGPEASPWYSRDASGELRLDLYFFWSKSCPHCQEARPFVEALPDQYPWINLHSLEITDYPAHAQQYAQMAAALGQEAMYVPGFFYCGQMLTGYGNADTTGQQLVDGLTACRASLQAQLGAAPATGETAAPAAVEGAVETAAETAISLPLLGTLDAQRLSLPLFTVVLAGLDAFNPCAFFVLLFLLSLMVHAQDRRRMLLVGGIFILFSGLIYFVFMAAWLNIFLWVGELRLITLLAGLVAMAVALINIKDFFWFKQGVSLSIPESAKPGLYQRMRGLVHAGSLPALITGTVLLAIAANSYELLCTSGFPMVYTRVLTLSDLPAGAYYAYLAAYNVVYVLPLFAIVALFSIRFGARKLSEAEGRVLKLLSGVMMLLLGAVLVFAPELLNQVWTAVLLLAAAIGVTALAVWLDRRSRRPVHRRVHGHGKLRPR